KVATEVSNLKTDALAEELVKEIKSEISPASRSSKGLFGQMANENMPQLPTSPLTRQESTAQLPSRAADYMITEANSTQSSTNINTSNFINKGVEISLQAHVQSPQWSQKFAEHVSMLALRGATNAQIRLNPPELGPLSVKVQTHGNETQIQFMVTNPIARDLVDSGMHRLREMLEQQGFENVDVDVNEFSEKEQQLAEESSIDQEYEDNFEQRTTHSESQTLVEEKKSLIDLFA
ncbi:MAG: hypothetical protein DRQ47_04585, partial [Gammaproteobacteria bacterium]